MSKLLSTFNAELHVTKEGGAILKDLAHGRSLYFQPGDDALTFVQTVYNR